ncbi:Spt20 family-domain-containing protein [Mycotypha africana]|uniref:Spt20 family-domain-containing protein n=1 Tax=Mycotypha africana TaxID=64632 RepID=UPI0023019372|nr:Spt20 family-domain-containing protein [Mycotypha africana]KAI8970169.1 Spt20 family-domain-containing protein [Mycotypha africana]
MASAKVIAKLQANQNAMTQLAELHSKQGSILSSPSLAATNKKQIANTQRWQQPLLATQSSQKIPPLRDEKALLKRHENDPPSLCLHLYPTYFKFEHEDGFFSYKSQFEDFLKCIKEKRLPDDLMDVFNEASCRFYDGCLIVEIHDNRMKASDNMSKRRIVMRPTAASIWTDIILLSEEWGFPWTDDIALELEAHILIATEEPLCLDPTIQVSRLSNAIEFTTQQRRPKKRAKYNSVEREQKLAKEAEKNKLMTLMDSRAKRGFPFEPNFGKLSFIHDWRVKRTKQGSEPLPAIDIKKGKGRKGISEPSILPDGKKCCRTIRFERSENGKKVFTIVNIYTMNGEYNGVFRWGTVYDTSIDGGNIDFDIGPEYLMESYVIHLKATYGQFNTLVCDNSAAAVTNVLQSSPSVNRLPPSSVIPPNLQQQQVQQQQQQVTNFQLQQLHAQQNRAMQAKAAMLPPHQRALLAQAQAQQAAQQQNILQISQPPQQLNIQTQVQAPMQSPVQSQTQAQAQAQAQAHIHAQNQASTQPHMQQNTAQQSRASTPTQSHVSSSSISQTPIQQAASLPAQSIALPNNGIKSQQQTPTQSQAQLSAQHMAALRQQQQQQQQQQNAAIQALGLQQQAQSQVPQQVQPQQQPRNMLSTAPASQIPNMAMNANNNIPATPGLGPTITQAQLLQGGVTNNTANIQQIALAQALATGSYQGAMQKIQQWVTAGALPLGMAQQLVSQIATRNVQAQQAMQQAAQQSQQQQTVQQAPQMIPQQQAAAQQQFNQQSPVQQRVASTIAQPQAQSVQQQTSQQLQGQSAASQLFAQLSPELQQQMATLLTRRNQLFALAQQRAIPAEQLKIQYAHLQQAHQNILQQHQQQQQAQLQTQQSLQQQAQARAAAQAAQATQVQASQTPQMTNALLNQPGNATPQTKLQQTPVLPQQQQTPQLAQQSQQQQHTSPATRTRSWCSSNSTTTISCTSSDATKWAFTCWCR